LRGNQHKGLAFVPLHENQEGVAVKWFLTGKVLRATDKDGIEVEDRREGEYKLLG
jgi:hypothetical protein